MKTKLNFSSSLIVLMILVPIATIFFAISARSHFEAGNINWWSWLDGASQNFSTEMMGALVAFVLFDQIIEARRRKDENQIALNTEIDSLIIGMQSKDEATAEIAFKQASGKLMFQNGLLEGKLLNGVNLQGQSLIGSRLRGTILMGANLQGANLTQAHLEGAILTQARLEGAYLNDANLQGADLYSARLRGADLTGVNLADTNIKEAGCNEETTLPDGTKWTSDVDWSKF